MKFVMPGSRCAIALLLLGIGGCSRSPGPEAPTSPQAGANAPASAEEKQQAADRLLRQQLEVDTLYFAEDGREVIAPGNDQHVVIDPVSGGLAWGAWQCDNPSCPDRKPDGRPFLFPWPSPFCYVTSEQTVGRRQPVTDAELRQAEELADVRCPACLKNRNLAVETPEVRLQYRSWCRQHVLPQAAEQRVRLAEEYRRLHATGATSP
jgi:hypothetical protein